MIYIKDFGHRLGNQLFQIAAAYSLSRERNDSLMIPYWEYAKHFRGPFLTGGDNSNVVYTERGFNHSKIECGKHKSLAISGLYQSEKYFCRYADEIREMFTMNCYSDVMEEVNANATEMAAVGPTCSVHIRRGDYLNYPNHHPTLSPEWYAAAISQFPEDTVFWIFSDDIEWTKANIRAKNIAYQHSSDVSDFFSMSLCNHHIIANSTFSWWAAWLNPSCTKRVIAPSNWFGPAYGHWNTDDLYPQGWTRL